VDSFQPVTRGAFSRRAALALPFALAACRRASEPFSGYAFIANQEGGAIAVVDLSVMAVVKHISIEGAPTEVHAGAIRPAIYALTPETGGVHEIHPEALRVERKTTVGSRAARMLLSPDEALLYVLVREPRSLAAVDLESFRIAWRLALTEEPGSMAVSSGGETGAVASGESLRLLDLKNRRVGPVLGGGVFGEVRFLTNSRTVVAANLEEHLLSVYRAPRPDRERLEDARLVAHLPLAVRPEHLCFSRDGGQLFVTGAGMDAVVIVYPYNTPQVAETVLAGHAPGAMAASGSLLFVANPSTGDVSILSIATHRVIAVAQVGSDPGFIAVTPDDEYALVLNRQSGDVAVLRLAAIQPNRFKSASLLTVIPVGSRPVSAALRAV
jgi:DNA-binding beta-propeller fold protein YncE